MREIFRSYKVNSPAVRRQRKWVLNAVNFWHSRWGERSFLAALAILIGVFAGLAEALLHWGVEKLAHFVNNVPVMMKNAGAGALTGMILFALFPLIGMVLSYIVQRTMGGARYAKSLSPLILALHRKRPTIPLTETFSHLLSSALAVGCGGSAGLEAPSVLTGAAIGANTGSFFFVAKKRRALLLGCGTSAAIAAIFDSPIAGVLFAAEVLLPEFSVSALVPMIMSSAVASVVSRMLVPDMEFFLAATAPWRFDAVPCYVLCGAACALVGVYVIKTAYKLSGELKKRLRNPWIRLFTAGGILCLILWLLPVLRGQGYWFIERLFAGDMDGLRAKSTFFKDLPNGEWLVLILLVMVILLKVVAAVLTVDGGGDGGIFAPSMFIGAFTGFAFAHIVNMTGVIFLQENNFVAIGMCGVFTAVMRAPLTGIFLIAEITRSYTLLVPLMIVSSVAYFFAHLFEPNSIYRKALAESNLLVNDRDQTMLRRLQVKFSMKRHCRSLRPGDRLAVLIEEVENSPGNPVYPVLDGEGHLLGIVYLERVLKAMLKHNEFDFLLIYDVMENPPEILNPDDDLAKAMAAFDLYRVDVLPVCSNDGVFQGLLEKTPIFSKYRCMVKETENF
ncbi:MAG: chloride channel protein [Lentisphaeria bacterium]|nr:chloride channel protein [Lentisphaerota bacterium]MBR7144454.1 chloride channel protein [Lentisphaeria bacterium]